jgi:hypothetical protein
LTVKLNVPVADGVPVITPPLDMDVLVGSEPLASENVRGAVPPYELIVSE